MSEIKWAYDKETNSFSALPASNFLLLALGLLGILPFIERLYWHQITKPRPCPDVDLKLYEEYAKDFKKLAPKFYNSDGKQPKMTLDELIRWERIIYPPWCKPGEVWHYPLD